MSDVELERAAMAPHRWIKLCDTFARQHGFDAALRPTTTRIVQDPLPSLGSISTQIFFVPGGRYCIGYSSGGICVWDLGYRPDSDCKLLASVGPNSGTHYCLVNTTSDGMGLIIVVFGQNGSVLIYEIYPQNESPQLTQIADCHFAFSPFGVHVTYHLLPNKIIRYEGRYKDKFVFMVWDYRMNHSIRFWGDVDGETSHDDMCHHEIIATETTIILLCREKIIVWGIPPLSLEPPDSLDHTITHLSPLFRIPWPDDLIRQTGPPRWEKVSEWYSGSSQSIYFGVLFQDSKLVNFEIVIKPDLSDISLHVVKTFQLVRNDTFTMFTIFAILTWRYRICEDTLVSCGRASNYPDPFIVYIRSMSSPPDVISLERPLLLHVSLSGSISGFPSSCPASGRFVHQDFNTHRIVVDDFLP